MKRYLIALGVVFGMLLTTAPVAAAEPSSSKDDLAQPVRSIGSGHQFFWLLQSESRVEQSNDNESGDATAVNYNNTDQSNDQKQLGVGGDATSGPATADGRSSGCEKDGHWYPKPGDVHASQANGSGKTVGHCASGAESGKAVGGDVDQSQWADNANQTEQNAAAESKAYQIAPINVNAPIRLLSFGDDKVEQSNDNESGDATAINKNTTDQSNDQAQYGFGGDAESGAATSSDESDKCGCSGGGDASTGDAYGGDVDQSQDASNANQTSQNAEASSKAVQVLPINGNLLGGGLLGGGPIN
jgi:hypothetical protein